MAIKLIPGSQLTLGIHLQERDTLAPIAAAPVFLDFLEQPTAAPQQIAGAQTDGSGNAVVQVTVPTAPGSYRYRSRTPGVAERYRADTSAHLTIEVPA